MNGHTKGRVEAKQNLYGRWSVYDDDGPIIDGSVYPNPRDADQATLIAEAFNVADETGRTPRQLADERAELVGALEGAEIILAKLDTIRYLDKSFGGLDQLRAILAKVKGPVPS